MQLQSPLSTITSSVDGELLGVLARTPGRQFALSEISALVPGRSYAGLRNSAERLVEQGIVLGARYGNTKVFSLNTEHLAAPAIISLEAANAIFLERLATACAAMPVVFAAVFGSAARGEMRPDSDIDLFFVARSPADADEVDDAVFDLAGDVRAWTGNEANPVVFAAADVRPGVPLFASVAEEGIVVAGDRSWLTARLRSRAS